jgi:glycosyltransferase involved in cell wall biosynthesis
VSNYTASELRRRFGSDLPPISVVHSGVDPAFSNPLAASTLDRSLEPLGLRRDGYILHAGAVDPRKNTSVVLEAFQRYRAGGGTLSLGVIGLSGLAAAPIRRLLKASGGVRVLPFVSNATVVALVQAARVVVYVPTEEGFGYPLVEALAAGTPVVASDIEVLRELSDGTARAVQPGAAEPLAAAMASFDMPGDGLEELRHRGRLRAAHFSISNMADNTIDAYEAALETRRTVRRGSR